MEAVHPNALSRAAERRAGVTDDYTYSPAGEVESITSSQNDSTHPPDLVSNVQNGPFGARSWRLGNGLTAVRQYDSMGRVAGGWLCNGSSQPSCSGGTELYNFSSYWVGSYLTGACDWVMDECNSYAYDHLGRLRSVTVNSGTPGNYTYVYDRWGNRWQQNAESGGPSPQLTFNTANNEIITGGYTYDAAGNMTSDGIHTYTYDADGNLIKVDNGTTAIYTYNALNERVQVSNAGQDPQEFFFSPLGQRTSIWDGTTGGLVQGQTYWGASPVEYYSNDYAHFETQDWVGTERTTTNYTGAVEGTFQSLPFGDGYSVSGADDDPYHFAGLDHDYSSDTDHAQFRQYSPMTGRWMSPDPYAGSYNLGDPQSFDRYTYSTDNPLSFLDPIGLQATQTPQTCTGGICYANNGPNFPFPNFGGGVENPVLVYLPDRGHTGAGYVAPINLPPPTKYKMTLPGTNYCGPGGSGSPTDATDAACAAHDLCYYNAGASWFNNVLGTGGAAKQAAIHACNAQLCSSMQTVFMADPGSPEASQAEVVGLAFGCMP